jgi:flagellar basal body L-ring protein FlgH
MKMKKLTITGLILVFMAVSAFLACAQAPKKTKAKSKHMKITISTETGQLVKITDENGNPAKQLTPAELQQIYDTQNPQHIGTILYTHSSPGCVIIHILGSAFKICF